MTRSALATMEHELVKWQRTLADYTDPEGLYVRDRTGYQRAVRMINFYKEGILHLKELNNK